MSILFLNETTVPPKNILSMETDDCKAVIDKICSDKPKPTDKNRRFPFGAAVFLCKKMQEKSSFAFLPA